MWQVRVIPIRDTGRANIYVSTIKNPSVRHEKNRDAKFIKQKMLIESSRLENIGRGL